MIRYLILHAILSVGILWLLFGWRRVQPRIRFWLAMVGLVLWFLPLPAWQLSFDVPETIYSYSMLVNGTDANPSATGSVVGWQAFIDLVQPVFTFLVWALMLGGFAKFLLALVKHRDSVRELWGASVPVKLTRDDLPENLEVCIKPGCGAMTTGWPRPVVWIGRAHVNDDTFDALLEHELTHIRQRDNLLVHFIHFAECVFWWNPLVRLLAKEARFSLELSCDHRCQQALGNETYRRSLAQIILEANRLPVTASPLASAAVSSHNHNMRRLKSLDGHFSLRYRHLGALILLALTGLALTARPGQLTAASGMSHSEQSVAITTIDQPEENIPRVGAAGVAPPIFTKKIAPNYPKEGLKIKLQGYVILEAVLRKNGTISDVQVLRSLGKGEFGFEEAATEALRQWEFQPGKVNGVASDVRMTLKIDFVLNNRP